jgi:hypothetical protein
MQLINTRQLLAMMTWNCVVTMIDFPLKNIFMCKEGHEHRTNTCCCVSQWTDSNEVSDVVTAAALPSRIKDAKHVKFKWHKSRCVDVSAFTCVIVSKKLSRYVCDKRPSEPMSLSHSTAWRICYHVCVRINYLKFKILSCVYRLRCCCSDRWSLFVSFHVMWKAGLRKFGECY